MHVNPVAFALASLEYADPKLIEQTSMTSLVNFGFEKSGISCADKMHRFNSEHMHLVHDVAGAAAYYNMLAGEAAKQCQYFNGVCTLIERHKTAGVLNFITSAVEQPVLDIWAESDQGKQVSPHLTEVLGKRPNFEKGEQHFRHAREQYEVAKIFYVADAVAEIANGAQFSQQLNIQPIGFAHVITPAKVRLAHKLVMDAHKKLAGMSGHNSLQQVELHKGQLGLNQDQLALNEKQLELNEDGLCLPDENALTEMLKGAHAASVVGGNSDEIINNLTAQFETLGILA